MQYVKNCIRSFAINGKDKFKQVFAGGKYISQLDLELSQNVNNKY